MADTTSKPKLSQAALKTLFQDDAQEKHFLQTTQGMAIPLAAPLIEHMGLDQDSRRRRSSPSSPVALLDLCCGAGLVRQEVGKTLGEEALGGSSFVCADSSDMMVGIVEKRIAAEGWANTEARVLDAQDTGLAENSFTHVAISLGIHLVPDPVAVFRECHRILKDGGTLGASTFHASCADTFWRSDMRAAFASFPFEAPFPSPMPLQAHDNGRWDDEAYVAEALRGCCSGGFADVDVRVRPGRYRIAGPEAWVDAFGSMLAFVMNTWWSEDLRARHPLEEVKGLVLEYLRGSRGEEEGGWDVTWSLITVTGKAKK
ncbi:hypothetical protein N3K66_008972 [Trichothecium roseum]|uniref:Uncharacterized protein n=1 Tax=Trichothecium roseum TaxID=47278 RepID=A0ACC0US55_9HYPO|nr:hypothetical protein N3K66_008972 [Trichothecium roseum]